MFPLLCRLRELSVRLVARHAGMLKALLAILGARDIFCSDSTPEEGTLWRRERRQLVQVILFLFTD